MTRLFLAGLGPVALAALTACTPTQQSIDRLDALSDINCASRPDNCAYENSPVKVGGDPITLPRRPYRFFRMTEQMRFADARGKAWTAPTGTLTDGASIPPIFVAIVGQPTAPEYVNAGALHDAYCGIGNEGGPMYHEADWQDVHRMFFDGLVVSGTPPRRALVMFAAVWLGGPRWNYHYGFNGVPAPIMQRAMRDAKAYVEREDPSLSQLERYLLLLEKKIIRENAEYFPQLHGGGEDQAQVFDDFSDPEPEPEPEPEDDYEPDQDAPTEADDDPSDDVPEIDSPVPEIDYEIDYEETGDY